MFNVLILEYVVLMIFLFVILVFVGFGNYVILLMFGVVDMVFLWLNVFLFWLLLIVGVMFVVGMVILGGGLSVGWIVYVLFSVY